MSDNKPVRATLEFEPGIEGEAPTGALLTSDGRRDFRGWIELAATIEDWRQRQECEARRANPEGGSMTDSSSDTTVTMAPAETVGAGYAAFGEGDIPAVLALFADDITWHISGHSPLAGDYTGHDEVLGFFGMLVERSNGTFNLEIHDLFDNGRDTAIVLVTERAERNGKRLEVPMVHVWRVEAGKATRFQAFVYDEYTVDEFWS